MVQIGRRVLSNYFKVIIRNRLYTNNTCILKNEVSRTPMWTRDFWAPYHNIQIINRRLQLRASICDVIRIITYKSLTGDYSVLHVVTRALPIITYKSLTRDYSI